MRSPSPERKNLYDLAVANLRRLFPRSQYVQNLNRKLKPATTGRCQQKACPFPIYDHERGLCRGHLADAMAQYSTLPSALGAVIQPTHAHT
jgi:hypothetical protein